MKRILIMIVGLMMSLQITAQKIITYEYKGQTLRYEVISEKDKTVAVCKQDWLDGAVEIPSEVSDGNVYQVVSIGYGAFSTQTTMTSITIPNSVTSIGNYAFATCNRLTSLTIPESVTSIGMSAFAYCSNVTSLTIPESVTSIANDAFIGTSSLEKVEFASLEALCKIKFETEHSNPLLEGHNLYIAGQQVTDVVIPESITSIGNYTFCGSNITSITVSNSVTSIGKSAFKHCSELTSISIGESVTSIGKDAFFFCDSLEKADFASIEALCKINFEDNYSNPLYKAHNLYIAGNLVTEVVIPESITSIGDWTFDGCRSMTSVTIPNSVISIGERAFDYCLGLTSITIPESVTTIREYAFSDCSNLEKAEFASIEALCKINFKGAFSNPLYYAHNLYIAGKPVTEVVIPESFSSIGDYTFKGCNIISVTIPNSITSIGSEAFGACKLLSSISIPNSVTSIGSGAFAGCGSLTSVTIPESVTSIGKYAFENCLGLTSVTIPKSVTSIGGRAFFYCTGLTSVYYETLNPIIGDSDIFDASYYDYDLEDLVCYDIYAQATLFVPEEAVDKCKEIEPWKYFSKIEAYVFAEVEEVIADFNSEDSYEVFDINGLNVGNSLDSLAPGLYVVRQGKSVKKISVK